VLPPSCDSPAPELRYLPDLIDTILSIHSVVLPVDHLRTASTQITTYYQRFKNRLKPVHAVHLKQCLAVIQGLITVCEEWSQAETEAGDSSRKTKSKEELVRVNDVTTKLKGGADQVNLIELVRYLKDSHLAQKVSGYMEKTVVEAMQKGQFCSNRCATSERLTSCLVRCTKRYRAQQYICFPSGRGILNVTYRGQRRRTSPLVVRGPAQGQLESDQTFAAIHLAQSCRAFR